MTPIGETLRRERLKKNLDLNQVSNQLKIAPRFLEAIEEEQFDRLPGTVFAKAFVRQYARALGLEEEEFAGQVKQLLEPPPVEAQFAQALHENKTAPIHVPPVEEWETQRGRDFKWPSWIPATGLVIVAMLACSFVYAWWQRDRHTVSAQGPSAAQQQTAVATTPAANSVPGTLTSAQKPAEEPPAPAEAAVPDVTKPAEKPVEKAAEVAPPKTTAPAEGSPAVAAPKETEAIAETPKPNGPVHVVVTADEDVWVSARADGKYLFSSTLGAHESRKLDGSGNVTLRLGNAGGVNITVNGRPIGPVGGKGQARTVQLTSGGFQIEAAPKPSLPPL
jgi:cytoskeleton protein RodZ